MKWRWHRKGCLAHFSDGTFVTRFKVGFPVTQPFYVSWVCQADSSTTFAAGYDPVAHRTHYAMKHADADALETLADLLAEIRQIEGLTEKKQGIFYRKSQAFLHFHTDPTGLFADVRPGRDWERFPVNTAIEQAQLLAVLKAIAPAPKPNRPGLKDS